MGPLPHTPWDYLTPHGTPPSHLLGPSLTPHVTPHTPWDPPSHPMGPLTPHRTPHTPRDLSLTLHGTLSHLPCDTPHGTPPSHSVGPRRLDAHVPCVPHHPRCPTLAAQPSLHVTWPSTWWPCVQVGPLKLHGTPWDSLTNLMGSLPVPPPLPPVNIHPPHSVARGSLSNSFIVPLPLSLTAPPVGLPRALRYIPWDSHLMRHGTPPSHHMEPLTHNPCAPADWTHRYRYRYRCRAHHTNFAAGPLARCCPHHRRRGHVCIETPHTRPDPWQPFLTHLMGNLQSPPFPPLAPCTPSLTPHRSPLLLGPVPSRRRPPSGRPPPPPPLCPIRMSTP